MADDGLLAVGREEGYVPLGAGEARVAPQQPTSSGPWSVRRPSSWPAPPASDSAPFRLTVLFAFAGASMLVFDSVRQSGGSTFRGAGLGSGEAILGDEGRRELGEGGGRRRPSGHFLHISDLHFDPWYNASIGKACFCNEYSLQAEWCDRTPTCSEKICPGSGTGNIFGQEGCDVPKELLSAALQAAEKAAPPGGYDWVLVTGDYVRHKVNRLSVSSTKRVVRGIIEEVTKEVRKRFPSARVHHNIGHAFFSLGNDDFGADYDNTVGRASLQEEKDLWYSSLAEIMLPVPETPLGGASSGAAPMRLAATVGKQSRTFPDGGYFLDRLADDLYLVSLNTVIYSAKHTWNGEAPKDPYDQFAWLGEVFQMLSGAHAGGTGHTSKAKVLIVGHIPPTLNNYDFSPQWRDEYLVQYMNLVEQYSDLIAAQLFGHLHQDTFRMMPSDQFKYPIFVSGGVSPVFENNPSFRVWKYEGTDLLDYTVYGAAIDRKGPQQDLVFERLYSALETFGLKTLAASEWSDKVAEPLRSDDSLWNQYVHLLWLRDPGDPSQVAFRTSPAFRVKSVCSIFHTREEDFARCAEQALLAV